MLRNAYLESTEDLRYYFEKLKRCNQQKKAIRDYLQSLMKVAERLGSAAKEQRIDPCGHDEATRGALAKMFDEQAASYDRDAVACVMCIPDRVPSRSVSDFTELAREISSWEERLSELGDDEQLANINLQEALQKQQQTLQMMSNISKMLYDTAQSVIRKMGG